ETDLSVCPQSECEAGWEKHGGNCYYFSTTKSSWNDSRRSCADLGSDLVKIDSREEQIFSSTFPVQMFLFWIGLTDLKEEGRWFWVDGSPLDESVTFWNDREPDNRSKDGAGSADCGRMGRKREYENLKSWFDISCNYPHKSICEKTLIRNWKQKQKLIKSFSGKN
uniref:C-type lectin domain-containing protein n=1 Tax=Xiphophorus maculatus TaxID=8083 RepID=A0A3B5QYW8_XIPMA